MPVPDNKYAIIDIYSYKILNKFSLFLIRKNVKLSPNFISLLQIPCCYLLYIFSQKKKTNSIFFVSALIGLIDNLDGTHARNTGKVSKLGMYLDHYMDMLATFTYNYIILNEFIPSRTKTKILLPILFIFYISIKQGVNHEKFENKLFLFGHDHAFLLKICFSILWYSKSIKKKNFLAIITGIFGIYKFFEK